MSIQSLTRLFLFLGLHACTDAQVLPSTEPGDAAPSVEFTELDGTVFRAADIEGTTVYATPDDAPLLLVVQGSGCEPVFSTTNAGRSGTAGQDIIHALSRGRFRIMIVEKPGVSPMTAPAEAGEATGCSEAYQDTHDLESWVGTLGDVLDEIEQQDIRVIGLSEGAVTAARLAANRKDVSHVAFISGFGCLQLDDVLVTARRDWLAQHPDASAQERQEGVQAALSAMEDDIARVLASPDSAEIWNGQTHRFWTSFGLACPAQDLARTDAEIFVAYGTADEQISADGVEEIIARRLLAGKPTQTLRVLNGGHILDTPDAPGDFTNLLDAFSQALDAMED